MRPSHRLCQLRTAPSDRGPDSAGSHMEMRACSKNATVATQTRPHTQPMANPRLLRRPRLKPAHMASPASPRRERRPCARALLKPRSVKSLHNSSSADLFRRPETVPHTCAAYCRWRSAPPWRCMVAVAPPNRTASRDPSTRAAGSAHRLPQRPPPGAPNALRAWFCRAGFYMRGIQEGNR